MHYRTLWISDLHLGTRGSQAGLLLDFLRHNESDTLYLVGDIVDGWALKRSMNWGQLHNDVVQKLLRRVRKGTRAVYIPGNHDEFARAYVGYQFGGIDVLRETVHTTADGRRLLILHGDEFDGAIRYAPWLSKLGARAYELALALNTVVNGVRKAFGKPYWSLAAYLKGKTKKAVQYMGDFEEAVAALAKDRGVDGVVCGHIHKPELREIDGVLYANCGDWVESCTALAEHHDGRLEILTWRTPKMPDEVRALRKRVTPASGKGLLGVPLHGDGLPDEAPVLASAALDASSDASA
ncbi:MAG: UDP-2,3-diacylglucosamine diphosphatase [Bacteroidota bacterium]